MAREATPRRSARLGKAHVDNTDKKQSTPVPTPDFKLQLASIAERQQTPKPGTQSSIDNVLSTSRPIVTTPKTEPRPGPGQMHPEISHRSTKQCSTPTSGERLGFTDISCEPRGSAPENTPSHPSRKSLVTSTIDPSFQFRFSHASALSTEGQKIMESIRDDAQRIKAQLKADKDLQHQQQDGVLTDIKGRRIAKPAGKAGRFSEVHMAEFKKMDSIADHPSAFRAKPGYMRPTTHSLKRSSSKADLDSPERPKTAGKISSTRPLLPVTGRVTPTSPFKSIRRVDSEEEDAPAKRLRRNGDADVAAAIPSVIPRPSSSQLVFPTKASAARSSAGISASSTPRRSTVCPPRTSSVKSLKSIRNTRTSFSPIKTSTSTPGANLPHPYSNKPLPPTPGAWPSSAARSAMIEEANHPFPATAEPIQPPATTSKLPMFAGLKSILRRGGKATPARTIDAKRPITVGAVAGTPKKVNFTPSVKSRYAVKLAATSPSPAKHDTLSVDKFEPVLSGDSSAIVVRDDDLDWEDSLDEDIHYPNLPQSPIKPGPVIHTFSQKAKDLNRRESKEFKSIFADLNPKPDSSSSHSLTSINTEVNKSNPLHKAELVAQAMLHKSSPPRSVVNPNDDKRAALHTDRDSKHNMQSSRIKPPSAFWGHHLLNRKRRYDDTLQSNLDESSNKENCEASLAQTSEFGHDIATQDPSKLDEKEFEPCAKRYKTDATSPFKICSSNTEPATQSHVSPGKPWRQTAAQQTSPDKRASKPNAAREQAKKTATERKIRGLSLSRLNALASPKKRV